jgi:2-desacetyl-2-hydroxyethyl bacteriochlorophyllide A dehydrogenase
MKAAVIKAVKKMAICEVPKPALSDGEALLRVKYIGICGTDIHVLNGHHATATYPVIPGHEFVGELAEIKGRGAADFRIGDLVVAQEIESCGRCDACAKGEDNVCKQLRIIGVHTDGGFAQYVKVPTRKMYQIPPDLDLELAALTEPLAVAVHDVRQSGLKVGETAFIIGGGPIGLLIAIVARASGARRVVIAEINDFRREFARQMGFTTVNPLDEHYEQQLDELAEGQGFDVSFEVAGVRSALPTAINYTKNTGSIVIIAISPEPYPVDTQKVFAKELTLKGVRIHSQYNFVGAINLIKSGALNQDLRKLISKVYPLDEIGKAFEHAQNGKDCFKILVKID